MRCLKLKVSEYLINALAPLNFSVKQVLKRQWD